MAKYHTRALRKRLVEDLIPKRNLIQIKTTDEFKLCSGTGEDVEYIIQYQKNKVRNLMVLRIYYNHISEEGKEIDIKRVMLSCSTLSHQGKQCTSIKVDENLEDHLKEEYLKMHRTMYPEEYDVLFT